MSIETFSAGQRLTASAMNTATMGGYVVFRAYRSASQTMAVGTDLLANALSYDQVDIDRLNGWASGSPTLWTSPFAAYWELAGSVGYNGNTGGTLRDLSWFVNGVLISAGRARGYCQSAIPNTPLTVEARTLPVFLGAGDTVALVPSHDSGTSIATATGSLRSFMSVSYAGPV